MTFRPKFITFDCYGTLTHFRIGDVTREIFADRVPAEKMDAFLTDFRHYRRDEVMGDWRPYKEVLFRSLERACRRAKVASRTDDALRIYEAVPTWAPYPDVPPGLSKTAKEFPLVILSNAANEQIHRNVAQLGAPFAHVFTAEMAGAYKPRLRAFEYMIDNLGCAPEDILHVSSSMRYDHMSAADIGIRMKAFVKRGHDPFNPAYGSVEIDDINGLPGLVGL